MSLSKKKVVNNSETNPRSYTVENSTQSTVVDAMNILNIMTYETQASDTPITLKLPPVEVQVGEVVRVTVQKINKSVSTDLNRIHILDDKKEESTMDAKVNQSIKFIDLILNIAVVTFFFSSGVFLLLNLSGTLIEKQDSFFAFLLSLVTGLLFLADKSYRRLINERRS